MIIAYCLYIFSHRIKVRVFPQSLFYPLRSSLPFYLQEDAALIAAISS